MMQYIHYYLHSYHSGNLGSSGFVNDPITIYGNKFFDVYPANNTSTNFINRILGDATGELGPFYRYQYPEGSMQYHNNWWGDACHFVHSEHSWFSRGGHYSYGVVSGPLRFYSDKGEARDYFGFRIVLAN